MYLPQEIPQARLLITVKTYPNPSAKYDELVCNAGFLETGEWVRLYPIKFRALPYDQQYSKYNWIQLDLVRNTKDFRLESYKPKRGLEEEVNIIGEITTGKKRDWQARKEFALREVFTSMMELITLSKERETWKSLATVKPKEIVDFVIEEDAREWKPKVRDSLQQMSLFGNPQAKGRELEVVRKLPYKYYYRFITEGDDRPRKMMILWFSLTGG